MLIFTYGMLTHPKVMEPDAHRLGSAMLYGYRWEMLQYANVVACSDYSTTGILWEIDNQILTELDYREGYPDFYDRIYVEVEHNNRMKSAWVYSMTPKYRANLMNTTPSANYSTTVTEGFAIDKLSVPVYN